MPESADAYPDIIRNRNSAAKSNTNHLLVLRKRVLRSDMVLFLKWLILATINANAAGFVLLFTFFNFLYGAVNFGKECRHPVYRPAMVYIPDQN